MGFLDQYGLRKDQISSALGRLKQDSTDESDRDDEFEGLVLGREDSVEEAEVMTPADRNLGRSKMVEMLGGLGAAESRAAVGDIEIEVEIIEVEADDVEEQVAVEEITEEEIAEEEIAEEEIAEEEVAEEEVEELPAGWREVELGSWNLQLLRSMDWKLFDEICAEMFRREGYSAELIGGGADVGIDMVLRPEAPESDGGTVAVRCKHYQELDIELKQVSDFRDSVDATEHEEMIFVTTGNFNRRALVDYGEEEDMTMLNGEALLERILNLGPEVADVLLKQVLADERGWQTPTCPACEVKMVWRSPKQGRRQYKAFWGCPNYRMAGVGRCRRTFNQA
ncbi:MAG: restriction endonuclease [Verrucomicrobiales bacterium]